RDFIAGQLVDRRIGIAGAVHPIVQCGGCIDVNRPARILAVVDGAATIDDLVRHVIFLPRGRECSQMFELPVVMAILYRQPTVCPAFSWPDKGEKRTGLLW